MEMWNSKEALIACVIVAMTAAVVIGAKARLDRQEAGPPSICQDFAAMPEREKNLIPDIRQYCERAK